MTNPRNGKNKRPLDQDFYLYDENTISDHESDRNVFPRTVGQDAERILDEVDYFYTEQKSTEDLSEFDSFFKVRDQMEDSSTTQSIEDNSVEMDFFNYLNVKQFDFVFSQEEKNKISEEVLGHIKLFISHIIRGDLRGVALVEMYQNLKPWISMLQSNHITKILCDSIKYRRTTVSVMILRDNYQDILSAEDLLIENLFISSLNKVGYQSTAILLDMLQQKGLFEKWSSDKIKNILLNYDEKYHLRSVKNTLLDRIDELAGHIGKKQLNEIRDESVSSSQDSSDAVSQFFKKVTKSAIYNKNDIMNEYKKVKQQVSQLEPKKMVDLIDLSLTQLRRKLAICIWEDNKTKILNQPKEVLFELLDSFCRSELTPLLAYDILTEIARKKYFTEWSTAYINKMLDQTLIQDASRGNRYGRSYYDVFILFSYCMSEFLKLKSNTSDGSQVLAKKIDDFHTLIKVKYIPINSDKINSSYEILKEHIHKLNPEIIISILSDCMTSHNPGLASKILDFNKNIIFSSPENVLKRLFKMSLINFCSGVANKLLSFFKKSGFLNQWNESEIVDLIKIVCTTKRMATTQAVLQEQLELHRAKSTENVVAAIVLDSDEALNQGAEQGVYNSNLGSVCDLGLFSPGSFHKNSFEADMDNFSLSIDTAFDQSISLDPSQFRIDEDDQKQQNVDSPTWNPFF